MDEFADDPPFFTEVLPPIPHKGRGAIGNPDPRFDAWRREAWSDGWTPEEAVPAPRTEAQAEAARSLLTRNQSPDLPFDRSANPYRGCEHGCIYCYARPSHARVGLSPGLDFETRIFYKDNAAALLRRELARPGYRCAPLALGTNTDVYQPLERQLGITRQVLQLLAETGHPVSIVTKSALVERDLDILAPMAARGQAEVMLSLNTLDRDLARRWEPRAASPRRRLEAMARLAEAGVPVGVLVAPIAPGLNDHELERILAASREAGAVAAAYTVLRLPGEVGSLFRDWLTEHAPLKAARVMSLLYDLRGGPARGGNDSRFGSRMSGLGHYAELLRQRFRLAIKRHAFPGFEALDCSAFQPPAGPGRRPAGPRDGDQLELF